MEEYMEEIWKDIVNYEGLYQISDKGNVKRLSRIVNRMNEGKLRDHNLKEKIMKCDEHIFNRRLRIRLFKNGKYKRYQLHRLVLETFVGYCPKGMECCHKDDNPKNNNLENLYWGSRKDNIKDKLKNDKICRGSRNGNSKLNDREVKLIKIMLKKGYSGSFISERFGISRTMVSYIKLGKQWSHIII
jgi:hypothetical protein